MKVTLSNCPLCDPGRPLPGDPKMDQCVISCMMLAPDFAVPAATKLLTPDDFCTEASSFLFYIVSKRHADGELVDPVSIIAALQDGNLTDKVGGPAFVSECYTASPNPAHVEHYAREVLSASKRRQMARIATRIVSVAIEGDGEGDWRPTLSALLRDAETTLADGAEGIVKSLRDVAQEYLDYYDGAGRDGIDPPVTTGISGLDSILQGGTRREYIIVGGKSGSGKTLLTFQIAGHLAESGRAGLFVGYEMSNMQILMRDLARETRLPLDEIMGRAAPSAALAQTVTRKISHWLETRRISMIDSPQITFEGVAAHARHLHRQGSLDFLIVDYLQLVPLHRTKDQRRDEVLAELSANLFRLRKQLGCTIIAPVQLNDDGLVRDSRAIVHAAEVYLRIEMEESENEETGEIEIGDTGIIRVLKNRFGPMNQCPVRREGQFQCFIDRKSTAGKDNVARPRSQNWSDRR
jgi:replicative DNA helicase